MFERLLGEVLFAMDFASKGQTLKLQKSVVRLCSRASGFSVSDWQSNQEKILGEIERTFGSSNLIVRSSCHAEDNFCSSNAGAFLSIPGVKRPNVGAAVDQVIASYGQPKDCDEIIVQNMVEDVCFSGVIFSHDPNNGTPYRVINWHDGVDTSFTSEKVGVCYIVQPPLQFINKDNFQVF